MKIRKWKIRKNFSEGISTATSMMGYRFENGSLVIIPEEAETVRMIFEDYLSGMGINAIVRKLRRLEIPTKHGGIWRENVVANMLDNEKIQGRYAPSKDFSVRPHHEEESQEYFCAKGRGEIFLLHFRTQRISGLLSRCCAVLFRGVTKKGKNKESP